MNTKSMLLAGGIAGIVMGVLAAIPLLGIVSSCCCLWAGLWGCGILAVLIYRLSNKSQPNLTVGQGVLLGLAAGLVGAVLASIFGALSSLIFGGMSSTAFMDYLNQIPGAADSLDASSRQMLEQFAATSGSILFSTVCNFVIFPVFGMIGSLIATALIWKNNPPAVLPPAIQ
jgi:ammonia channel protein AmtB